MSIVIDYSKYHEKYNRLPPEQGNYTLVVGNEELHLVQTTLKSAVITAKSLAKKLHLSTISVVDSI